MTILRGASGEGVGGGAPQPQPAKWPEQPNEISKSAREKFI